MNAMESCKRNPLGQAWPIAIALACFATSALADVNFQLTQPQPGSPSMAGVYISPYQANINGVSTLVVCDDFADNTYINESWTATPTDFSDLSNTREATFYSLTPDQITQDYTEIAWLTEQLLSVYGTTPSDTVTLGEISFAIWNVFDNAAIPYLAANDAGAGYDVGAQSWLGQAESMYNNNSITLSQFSNFTVYSPTSATPTCPGAPNCPSAPPQEFLTVSTPEPYAPALLGVYLSSLVGLIFLYRRRIVRSAS